MFRLWVIWFYYVAKELVVCVGMTMLRASHLLDAAVELDCLLHSIIVCILVSLGCNKQVCSEF